MDISAFSVGEGEERNHELRHSTAKTLSAAFADTGFAVVTGHAVPPSVVEKLRRSAFQFYDLDLASKRLVNGGTSEGYGHSPYCYLEENGAQLLGDFSRPIDVVESLTYWNVKSEATHRSLPEEPPELGPAILEYGKAISGFQAALQDICDVALDLPQGFMAACCDNGNESIRLAHYPELNGEPLEGQMRYGEHVDSYGITVLRLDPEYPEGLQVKVGDSWVDVPYIEDSYVLNVGACLSRWTNSYWKASVHRVLLKPGRRLSIVTGAVRPTPETLIEPIGPGAELAAKFPPVLMRDFAAERVAMHRPTYLDERRESDGPEISQEVLSREIRDYQR